MLAIFAGCSQYAVTKKHHRIRFGVVYPIHYRV